MTHPLFGTVIGSLAGSQKKNQKTCQCLSKRRKKPLPLGGSLVAHYFLNHWSCLKKIFKVSYVHILLKITQFFF